MMMSKQFRKLRAGDGQSGISLVELMITIMIFSLIMVMISGFFMSSTRIIDLSTGLTQNTKTVSNAMSATSRAIRAGTDNPVVGNAIPDPAFLVAKSDDIVFYAYVNLAGSMEQPVMYRFRVDRTTGVLTESQWPAQALAGGRWQFPSNPDAVAPTYTRTIAETIAPDSGTNQPFTFVLKGSETPVVAGAGGLSRAQRQAIIAVQVQIVVQSSLTDDSRRVTLVNLVGMPNLGFETKDSP